MSAYPALNTQLIGQTESALGAILDRLLIGSGTTFHEWLVLTVTAAGGSDLDRDQLIARISAARKLSGLVVQSAIDRLARDGLVEQVGGQLRVRLTDAGQARYHELREAIEEITARLFGALPAEDLATAGRVLAIVTARADAELAKL